MLTPYEEKMFKNILTLNFNVYYPIRKERPDYDDFIAMVKKRIDLFGDFLFTNDYSQFGRVKTFKEECGELSLTDISIKVAYFSLEEEPEYVPRTDLPPPVFTAAGKGVKRRQ